MVPWCASVTVQAGREVLAAHACTVAEDDREDIWAAVTARAPWYAQYQQQTERRIPLVRLKRVAGG